MVELVCDNEYGVPFSTNKTDPIVNGPIEKEKSNCIQKKIGFWLRIIAEYFNNALT